MENVAEQHLVVVKKLKTLIKGCEDYNITGLICLCLHMHQLKNPLIHLERETFWGFIQHLWDRPPVELVDGGEKVLEKLIGLQGEWEQLFTVDNKLHKDLSFYE